MTLSILIPTYNASNYISYCLDSLLRQDISKENHEIIIMDDGSTDDTVDIVKPYVINNSNILFYSQKNKGVYVSRNELLKYASGEYIYFLDADDYLVSNCLSFLLKSAIKYDLDILGFDTIETLSFDNHEFKQVELANNNISFLKGIDFLEKQRNLRHEVWWYFIKKTYLDSLNITFEEEEYHSDVMFTLKLLKNSKNIGFLPVVLHTYVQTPKSICRNNTLASKLKRIKYMHLMIVSYSKFINGFSNKEINKQGVAIKNLRFRRDVFSFFNLLKMIRSHCSVTEIKEKINALKLVNAYPINNFIGREYNSIIYKLLLVLINNKNILFIVVLIKNYLFKYSIILKNKRIDKA